MFARLSKKLRRRQSGLGTGPSQRRAFFEPLEERTLLAAFTVNDAGDDLFPEQGVITLRTAIVAAVDDDTIIFDSALEDGVIRLSQELTLAIDVNLEISGPTNGTSLTISLDGSHNTPDVFFFTIAAEKTVTISDLIIDGENPTPESADGAGISNAGDLTLERVTVANCQTTGDGGGIFNAGGGVLTVNQSTISGNSAEDQGDGGGIFNAGGGVLTVNNTTISGNSATTQGGGLFNASGGELTVNNTTIWGNSATTQGGGLFNASAAGLPRPTVSNSLSALLGHNMLKLAGKTLQYVVLSLLAAGVFTLPLIRRSIFVNCLFCASTCVLAQDVVEKIGINSSEKCGK